MPAIRPEPGASSSLSYATELQSAEAKLKFSPKLEREYLRAFLQRNRVLIRWASLLAVAITVIRAVDNTINGFWTTVPAAPVVAVIFALVACGSFTLAWLAWSSAFERRYMSVAQIVVPLRNFIAAAPVAALAAHGRLELLMILPTMVIAPFFFLGIQYRAALVTAALTVVSFASSAVALNLPMPILLRACGFMVLTLIACAIAAHELERWSRRSFLEGRLISELAQYDALTGTKNRRVFDDHFASLWRQAVDDKRTMAIALIDVDHFKAYNDCYGHQAGDQALRRVAQTLQTFVNRPLDVLARYGGEEFAVLFYDIKDSEVLAIADCMRRAVAGLNIEHRTSRTATTVTVSIGLAFVEPSANREHRGGLQLADQALYEAKVGGRNKVELKGGAEYNALVTGVFCRSPFAREQ